MIARQLFPGLHLISLSFVNVYLLDDGELTLIDAGIAGSEKRILRALAELGKQPGDLRHILITHLHMDHVGGLPALQRASGARVWMGAADAATYRQGQSMRPVQPAPGWLNRLVGMGMRSPADRPPLPETAPLAHELRGGERLDFAGGLQVIHAPGHTAGHTIFLWPKHGGVLILGDAASRMFGGLGWSFIYEDFEAGRRALQAMSALRFETVCFSHGAPVAAGKFKKRFGEE